MLAGIVAVVLGWRVVVAGLDAQHRRDDVRIVEAIRQPAGKSGADVPIRRHLARNPTDASALLALGLELELQERRVEADLAVKEALLLAPGDLRTLLPAAEYYLRAGRHAEALSELRRAADSAPAEVPGALWDVFAVALDTGQHQEFFRGVTRDNPAWWTTFFRRVCERGANLAAIQAVYAMRESTGLAMQEERECVVRRLQRDRQWIDAYQVWLSGLPPEQRQRIGYVFDGGFEFPLANHGFGWLAPPQDGVVVSAEAKEGMAGMRALKVAFANKRFVGPPVYQYLVLYPGRYRFEARARTKLESWLGLQWSAYCLDAAGRVPRQLFHTERLVGTVDWHGLRADFIVPKDCPAQTLRLELANPRSEANVPGSVAVRLNGSLWFDDLRVRFLD